MSNNYIFLKTTAILTFVLISVPGFSQPWSVFPPGENTIYFEDTNQFIYTLEIDSTYQNPQEKKLFLIPTMESFLSSAGFCDGRPDGGILTGNPIIEKDSVIEFHFAKGTVPLPLKGPSINYFTFEGESLSISRISERDTFINGVNDSIKEFSVATSSTLFWDCFNGHTIILSKHHGLLTTLGCFSMAPNGKLNTIPSFAGPVKRSPLKINTSKIWDFNIGDEFHYKYEYKKDFKGKEIYSAFVVTGKAINGNNYEYTLGYGLKKIQGIGSPSVSTTVEFGNTTWSRPVTFLIKDSITYHFSDTVPGYHLAGHNWKNSGRNFTLIGKGLPVNFDSCISYSSFDPYIEIVEHVEGLGEVINYKRGSDSGHNFVHGERLIYYKKGAETWGSPYYIGLKEDKYESVSLYPNPVTNKLTVKGLDPVQSISWKIMDPTGKVILGGSLENENSEIDVTHLQKGIYFLNLDNRSVFQFSK